MKISRLNKRLIQGVVTSVILGALLTACGTQKTTLTESAQTDVQLFTLQTKFYTPEEIDAKSLEDLDKLSLGDSPATALVPLVFSKNGKLLTTQEFNALVKNDNRAEKTETYFTDLDTYKELLNSTQSLRVANSSKLQYLRGKYAFAMPYPSQTEANLSSANFEDGKEVYLFDPYTTEYYTQVEMNERMEKKLAGAQTSTSLTQQAITDSITAVGDITWTNNSSSAGAPWTGHNGIITQLNNGALTGGRRLSSTTRTMEARGASGGSSGNSDVKTEADEVAELSISTSFRSGNQALLGIPGGMSDAKRIQMRTFARNQNPGHYSLTRGKNDPCVGNNNCGWYCSYLVWKAFINVHGLEIDSGGGYYVYPFDILESKKLNVYFRQYN